MDMAARLPLILGLVGIATMIWAWVIPDPNLGSILGPVMLGGSFIWLRMRRKKRL